MEESLFLPRPRYGGISALTLYHAWRNLCSRPVYFREKCLLSPYSLYGGIPALTLSTVRSNLCSHTVHCLGEFMLSPCPLYGRISAHTLFAVRRNLCLTLSTVWRNPCSHPLHPMEDALLWPCPLSGWISVLSFHCMEESQLSLCLLYGGIPAPPCPPYGVISLCSHPVHCMEESHGFFDQPKRAQKFRVSFCSLFSKTQILN
jgi:hypothetical protein